MYCSMGCVAFAWTTWINLIDFSPSRAVQRALNDVNKLVTPGYEADIQSVLLSEVSKLLNICQIHLINNIQRHVESLTRDIFSAIWVCYVADDHDGVKEELGFA